VDVSKYVSVMTQSAHPHLMPDGTVYTLGQGFGLAGAKYAVVEFPPAGHPAVDDVKGSRRAAESSRGGAVQNKAAGLFYCDVYLARRIQLSRRSSMSIRIYVHVGRMRLLG
jgi:hypothetical protein